MWRTCRRRSRDVPKLYSDFDSLRRYRRAEGFRVGLTKCKVCRFLFEAAIWPHTQESMIQCPACGQQNSAFFEFSDAFIASMTEPPFTPQPRPILQPVKQAQPHVFSRCLSALRRILTPPR